MAKIVIDARRLHSSTGRLHREYLSALETIDQVNDYHIIIHHSDQAQWVPKNQNVTMHVVKWDFYSLGEQIGYARFLRSLKPDLVHFMWPQQPILYFGKRITNVYDLTLIRFENIDKNRMVYKIQQFIFHRLLLNVIRRSKRVMAISSFVKKDLVQFSHVPPSKIVVAKPAVSDLSHQSLQPVSRLRGKDFIFYVGNAFPHKNLDRLVAAVELLHAKHPDLQLVIAGREDFFHRQLAAKCHDKPYVHILGYVEDGALAWLYKHCQAYVFPSLSEGFGLPGLEAMQHGVPLISSNATCLPEIYGDAAHYFDPYSEADMARAIAEVLRSKTRRETLVAAGYSQIKKFSWHRMALRTHREYCQVLSAKD